MNRNRGAMKRRPTSTAVAWSWTVSAASHTYAICVSRFGLGVHDFADQTWRDWYDDRVPPFDAVQMMAENEGLDVFEQEED